MRLSELYKPESPPPNPADDFLDLEKAGSVDIKYVHDGEVIEEGTAESFEQELVQSVDLLRQTQNWLGWFYQNDAKLHLLGEKSSASLKELVEEVEEFLGEYAND